MKHYAATVQCHWCGHRFAVCVHSAKLVASGKDFIVMCPENRSKLHVAVGALAPVDSCPPGAVVVTDDRSARRLR